MSAPTPLLEPDTVLAERFRIVRLLGSGGMGAVYEIEHEHTKHRRALKLLHPQWHDHETIVGRFLREASAAGRIGNPHIIETFDAGKLEGGEPYLVMELLEGTTLTELIERHPDGMGLAEVAALLSQACLGVQAAHDAGIIHRDLKPDNLFVTRKEGRPFVKVLDFGVSKFGAEKSVVRATATGSIVGTPLYMSPEQLGDAGEIDARSDVYALGVIAFEALTGSHPYGTESFAKLLVAILERVPPRITDLRSDLPAAVADVISEALAKDADERIPSAAALGEALERVAASPGVDALGATVASSDAEPGPLDATVDASHVCPKRSGGVRASVRPAQDDLALRDTELGAPPAGDRPSDEHGGGSRVTWLVLGGAVIAAAVGISLSLSLSSGPGVAAAGPSVASVSAAAASSAATGGRPAAAPSSATARPSIATSAGLPASASPAASTSSPAVAPPRTAAVTARPAVQPPPSATTPPRTTPDIADTSEFPHP